MKKTIYMLLMFVTISTTSMAMEISDVENHWAENDIKKLIVANAINGYEDGTFKPDNNITVAEFLKILVEYIDYEKVLEGNRWPDWYVNTAKYYGFITQNEFDNYDNQITRKEVSTILDRYIDAEDVKTNKKFFEDENGENVLRLASLGVITGYQDNTFRGEQAITRAEASAILCRAVAVRRVLVANKKYDLEAAEKLTNINKTPQYDSNYENRYEINNEKIYFYDSGRYAKLEGYTISEKNINNRSLVKLIKSLIQEDAYVAVNYVPDARLMNQIIINYGRQERYVYNNSYVFGFTFYEDKQYELGKISMNDSLSKECFMKITISRMWKDLIDFQNGKYTHELNDQKLYDALNAIFNAETSKCIYEYIQAWIPKLQQREEGQKFAECKQIGKYQVNLYTSGGSRVEIYISK